MPGNAAAFFEQSHQQENAYLGYSEIQLRTEYMSDVDARDVDISGQISTHYRLPVPILGAAMNCISEDEMAIAAAKVGAGAFIHHANSPEEQAQLVENVYHYLAGIIDKPLGAKPEQTIAEVLSNLEKRGKRFRTLPVIDDDGRCVGLMDKTCFRYFEFDSQTEIKNAMRPLGSFATAMAGVTTQQAYETMLTDRLEVLPLLDSDNRVVGLCLVDDILRTINKNPNMYSLDPKTGRLLTFASVPTVPEEAVDRVRLMGKHINVVGISSSHGESKYAVDTLLALKEAFSGTRIDFIAANISTKQTGVNIAHLEPNGVFIGQGPGRICISSDRLGFGTPQASAVYEVTQGVHSVDPDIPTLADGGIGEPADTVKARALGAEGTVVGGDWAGTDETPVPVLYDKNGAPYKEYWGMGSARAQEAFAAARQRYGNYTNRQIFVEGIVKRVPLKGSVKNVIENHVLGVKIAMAALGARNVKELQESAVFMRGSNRKD